MFWLTLIYLGFRLLLLLIAPDFAPIAVGQSCVNGQCNLPGRVVSYSPYGVGQVNWQPAPSQQYFAGGQIVGQPIPVSTKCAHSMCTNSNCTGNCATCAGCVHGDWRQVPGSPGQWAKYEGGKQVAGWDEKAGIYRTLNGETWGEPVYADWAKKPAGKTPSIEATPQEPAPKKGEVGADLPAFMRGGVNSEKTFLGREQFLVNGREVDPKVIEGGASNDPTVPDFTKHCQIVVTGKDAKAANALAEQLKANPVASKCWVVCADPQSWRMEGHKLDQDAEFQRTGQAVFLQGQPDKAGLSPVLDKVYEFSTADAIAQRFERKINPNYDPNKSPNGGGSDRPGLSKTTLIVIGGIVLALVFALTPPAARKEELQWNG